MEKRFLQIRVHPCSSVVPLRRWKGRRSIMLNTRTLILSVILGLFMASQTGCLLIAAGAGAGTGVAYVKGDTDAVIDGDTKNVTAASEKAMKDMELFLISTVSTGFDVRVNGRTACDTKVVVVVKHYGENLSKVSVRVGNFGDEALQTALLDKIRENVKTGATTASAD